MNRTTLELNLELKGQKCGSKSVADAATRGGLVVIMQPFGSRILPREGALKIRDDERLDYRRNDSNGTLSRLRHEITSWEISLAVSCIIHLYLGLTCTLSIFRRGADQQIQGPLLHSS